MNPSQNQHRRNRLLTALRPRDFALLEPHLQIVPIGEGEFLHVPGDEIEQVYFLHRGIVSLMAISEDGNAIATASVGSEGAIGTIAGTGRYGCRSRVICCRISISPCIRPKKQRTFGSQVPTAASGKNRNSLNIIRRADRPYPCGFCGGSLCANSGHSLSTTARISSEIWSMCSISRRSKSMIVTVLSFSLAT